MEDVQDIKEELNISGVDFLKLKKVVRDFLDSEKKEQSESANVL